MKKLSSISEYLTEINRLSILFEKLNENGLSAKEETEYYELIDVLSEVLPVTSQ